MILIDKRLTQIMTIQNYLFRSRRDVTLYGIVFKTTMIT